MSTSISNVPPPQTPNPTPSTGKGTQAPKAISAADAPVRQDTVHLSSAAASAQREASETPAQTAAEAGRGDVQAKHLLAKHAHAPAPEKHHVVA